ncbi:MAG: hypothetical protein Q9P44_15160 [Anaerolineae bacterium]|nr:hypothetical protein [Anaerolineae bacterium]
MNENNSNNNSITIALITASGAIIAAIIGGLFLLESSKNDDSTPIPPTTQIVTTPIDTPTDAPTPTNTLTRTPRLTNTPRPTRTPAPTFTPTEEGLLFYEDFEDGIPNNIVTNGRLWQVIQDETGNYVFEINETRGRFPGAELGSITWSNYVLEYRVRTVNSCSGIFVEFRRICTSTCDFYVQSLDVNGMGLHYTENNAGWRSLAHDGTSISMSRWHQIRVVANDELLSLFIDDELALQRADNKFARGAMLFSTFPRCQAQFDDIRVSEVND